MSHEIAVNADGRAMMAYVGEKPWHGLGQELEPGASIDVWAKASGMDMELRESPVFGEDNGHRIELPGSKMIYRGDNSEALAVVGQKYKLVQPIEILNFFKHFVGDFAELETAGVLFNGRSYWSMARLDGELDIAGDITRPYLLMNSSCDGSSSTTARLTTVRVVCNNTLSFATQDTPTISIRHNQQFCADTVAGDVINHYESFRTYSETMKMLAKVKVNAQKAEELITCLFDGKALTNDVKLSRNGNRVLELFAGEGIGATETAANGTAYGLLNAVTEFYDHEYGRTEESRLNDALFGYTAQQKSKFADKLAVAVAA